MPDVEIAVVGAGVIGLAVAARLAPRHPNLLVLERRARHGTEASSRNSEVIHAGLYYPSGSLKARLCVEGNHRLHAFCERHEIPHRRLGKLIVATDESETPLLEELLRRGHANGARLEMITGARARALEPVVPAVAALLSPDTGILSADVLMDCLKAQAEAAGATLAMRAEVAGIQRRADGFELTIRAAEGMASVTCERLVNAAGIEADTLAASARIDVDAAGYRQHLWKGHYFAAAAHLHGCVSRLVYPVPDATSLGIHMVIDTAGRLRFGPDAHYLARRASIDLSVDRALRPAFAEAARKLIPHLRDDDLQPDTCGVRAKLQAPGQASRDFVIAEETSRGLPGLVDLIGIDSPGLTSSLAIAEVVARLVDTA